LGWAGRGTGTERKELQPRKGKIEKKKRGGGGVPWGGKNGRRGGKRGKTKQKKSYNSVFLEKGEDGVKDRRGPGGGLGGF